MEFTPYSAVQRVNIGVLSLFQIYIKDLGNNHRPMWTIVI
jgi:hypothetical protein